MSLDEITTSQNIAGVPMPFVMVRRLPWPYGGKVILPSRTGAIYVELERLLNKDKRSKATFPSN